MRGTFALQGELMFADGNCTWTSDKGKIAKSKWERKSKREKERDGRERERIYDTRYKRKHKGMAV